VEAAKVPAPQIVASVLPVPWAYVPWGALVHEAAPASSPNEPAGQLAQFAVLECSDADVAGSDRYVPKGPANVL